MPLVFLRIPIHILSFSFQYNFELTVCVTIFTNVLTSYNDALANYSFVNIYVIVIQKYMYTNTNYFLFFSAVIIVTYARIYKK